MKSRNKTGLALFAAAVAAIFIWLFTTEQGKTMRNEINQKKDDWFKRLKNWFEGKQASNMNQ